MIETNKIYHGDALEILKTFPDEYVDCVMTSPPYWMLRDYGIQGQLGLEPTFQEYTQKLCDIFHEIKRVLKKTGSCWVNLGDSYSQSGGAGSQYGKHRIETLGMKKYGGHKVKGLPPKCLCLIPYRFAIEMTNRGWILRNVIIWKKNNCMPSSAADRFTVDFEPIFFFVKSERYYFEQQFEPHLTKENRPDGIVRNRIYRYDSKFNNNPEAYNSPRARTKRKGYDAEEHFYNPQGRNKRTTWEINTKAFQEAHFSVYPEKLCKIPIKSCSPENGIILDPFMGAGTTALVALKLGRKFIGIELNRDYIKIANKRIKGWLNQKRVGDY